MCRDCYTIDDAPVGTEYEAFRDFVRDRLAGVLQSRTPLRDSEGEPRRDSGGDVIRAHRETSLTEGTRPGRPHASLHDVWVAVNAVRNPPLRQARIQVHFHPSRYPSARSLTFTTPHRPMPVPPPPPPRGDDVIRRMRQTMRELGMRRSTDTFAYWFCQHYVDTLPTIPPDRNPPMITNPTPISGMPQYGGAVYNICFASLSGWWWDEMQTYLTHAEAGINATHYICRQRQGLQDVINYWAAGFTRYARSSAGESALNFLSWDEYGIFRDVMRRRPPEVTVTREMIRLGEIGTCSRWRVVEDDNSVPPRALNHVRCPCCPAREHWDPGGYRDAGCAPRSGIMALGR